MGTMSSATRVCMKGRTTGIVKTGLKLEMPEHMFARVKDHSRLECHKSLLPPSILIDPN